MVKRAEEFGPYLVYEQIGVGGMASVHRAEIHGIEGFSRPVALKRLLPSVAGDATVVQSFVREARLASHLRHENVAQTYELGKVGDVYFIAMELVTGKNLREILKQCVNVVGPPPVHIALHILNQLCDALDYAHNLCDDTGQRLNIIHRDVSPSNLIVSEGSGVLKLIDFGIAKARDSGIQTKTGVVKGKFSYMAPEYIDGRLDARADLFAVGVIAHELLSNRPLFRGRDDMDTLMRVKQMVVSPPSSNNPQVPTQVDEIVMTALQRDPDRRWQHATALRTAMTTVTKRLGLVATNTQVVEWIDWAFRQRKPPGIQIAQRTIPGTVDPGAAITKFARPTNEVRAARGPSWSDASYGEVELSWREPTSPPDGPSEPAPSEPAPSQPEPPLLERRATDPSSAFSSGAVTIETPARPTTVAPAAPRRSVLWIVLLLIAAGVTAGVVYFVVSFS